MSKVLVADDASFMRMIIRRIIEKEGHEVIGEANNGIVCVERYKELMPDFVTLDITMPEMDGITTLKSLLEYDPKANVVMISALGEEHLIREAIAIGAKNFIIKPFQEAQVVTVLRTLNLA